LRVEGICPDCSGPVEWSLDLCEDHDPSFREVYPNCQRQRPIIAREVCAVCKSSGEGTPSIKVMLHPAVVAFFHDHGVDWGFTGTTDFTDVIRHLKLVSEFEQELVSTDPPRVRVTIQYEGDELQLTLNEEMHVVDVTE
jgi:hypothetical protein